jgi:hypothetical protein
MNFDKYKFEVMLIVIVVVLLIFWLMINYFDNKRNNSQFAPINNNAVNTNNDNAYNVEKFANSTTPPAPRNTAAPDEKDITKNKDYLNAIANKLKNSNAEPAPAPVPSTNEANNNKNELEKNMSVAVQNSQLSKTNDSVSSFYSLSMDQINSLKQQTRRFGVLGLVFFDEKTDTLRIESTKA